MAADFYRSTHGNYWLVDRRTLASARALDSKYATQQELAWIVIWSANAIQKLGKRLSLRQQVVATAIIYLRRFYLRNSYCETDVPLVATACVYVAAKAEETAIHIKVVVTEARATFSEYGIANFPTDSTKVAEMEFYLIEDLEFHLIVYHPYRSLVHMTGRDSGPIPGRETMLDMDENSMQMAWFVLNDTYRSELCLLYPPHLLAIGAIYVAFSLHIPPNLMNSVKGLPARPASGAREDEPGAKRQRTQSFSAVHPPPGDGLSRSTNSQGGIPASMPSSPLGGQPMHPSLPAKPGSAPPAAPPRGKTDPITFLASLNVQMPIVLEIVQEIISLYALWKTYEDPPQAAPANPTSPTFSVGGDKSDASPAAGQAAANALQAQSPTRGLAPTMASAMGGFPGMAGRAASTGQPGAGDERAIAILSRMRMNRDMDLAHPAHAGAFQKQ